MQVECVIKDHTLVSVPLIVWLSDGSRGFGL